MRSPNNTNSHFLHLVGISRTHWEINFHFKEKLKWAHKPTSHYDFLFSFFYFVRRSYVNNGLLLLPWLVCTANIHVIMIVRDTENKTQTGKLSRAYMEHVSIIFLLLLLLRAFPFSLELIILNRFLNSIERKFSRLPSLSSSSLLRIICVQRRLKLMATSADFSYFMLGA